MSTVCASEAFYTQLENLRIVDFPCGLGSWRQVSDKRESRYRTFVQSLPWQALLRHCSTYTNSPPGSGGVQYESIEDLLELEQSAPYAVDCGWSKEAASLRKIAVESPESLKDPSFVLKHFTTLRIVDKNVHEIDEGLLQFINLKELILSANYISNINGRSLPKGLEVLELAANNIGELDELKSTNLCSLLHLGLAQNQVTIISSLCFVPSEWPSLLSLDLSYNNLTDLESTVEILKHLPVLRNLLLIGNPLYLSKCYHGFVIDSIPGLSYLDNHEVSADDKHNFKSFSEIKDLDVNSSYVTVEIAGIYDVKKPVQVEDPDAGEYPKIEYKYHVEFMFIKDVMLAEQDEDKRDGVLISTENLPWDEMLEFNFCKTFKISELDRLRSFLKNGVTFGVVAVKHSYVLEDPGLTEEQDKNNVGQAGGSLADKQSVKTSASKDRLKVDAKNVNVERKKSAKTKSTTKVVTGKEKGGRKDKRDVSELFELPQERKIVGTCHVLLPSFVEGETVVHVSSPCLEESAETETESGENDQSTGGGNKQSDKRSDDKKKGKADGDKQMKAMPPTKGKAKNDRGKSANPTGGKVNKGGGKGKEKMEELSEAQGDEEAQPPPPPLSIKLEIRLERLTSTNDILQESKS